MGGWIVVAGGIFIYDPTLLRNKINKSNLTGSLSAVSYCHCVDLVYRSCWLAFDVPVDHPNSLLESGSVVIRKVPSS
jgi:hypothetical protein